MRSANGCLISRLYQTFPPIRITHDRASPSRFGSAAALHRWRLHVGVQDIRDNSIVTDNQKFSDSEFPGQTNALWRCKGIVILEAPPEKVFTEVAKLVKIDPEEFPESMEVSIDHSASQGGPDQWGVGSVLHLKELRREIELTIVQSEPYQLMVTQGWNQTKKRTIRSTITSVFQPSLDGGTIMTTYCFATPDDRPWPNWQYQRRIELAMHRELRKLVNKFGGKIVYVDEIKGVQETELSG
jgi:hypothetical protein